MQQAILPEKIKGVGERMIDVVLLQTIGIGISYVWFFILLLMYRELSKQLRSLRIAIALIERDKLVKEVKKSRRKSVLVKGEDIELEESEDGIIISGSNLKVEKLEIGKSGKAEVRKMRERTE